MVSILKRACTAGAAFALFAAASTAGAQQAAPIADPGLWEVATQVDLPKLPFGMSIPRNLPLPQSGSRRFCVAQADLENPQSLVRAQTGCELDEWRQGEGGRISWKASCRGQVSSDSSGTLTLADNALEGKGAVTARIEGFSLPMQMSYSGRRLGDCP